MIVNVMKFTFRIFKFEETLNFVSNFILVLMGLSHQKKLIYFLFYMFYFKQ